MVQLSKEPQTCFVIAPIGAPDSTTRKKSDQVFRHIITKAIEPLGYKATRADQIHEPGIITSQIIRQIVDSHLVIADLSDRNPNVFYELAVRHVTKKPLVMLITRGEPIPFDVSANRVIQYDLGDLDTVELAKEELVKQINSLRRSSHPTDNPIANAVNVKFLKESGNPEQRSIADIMEALEEIRARMASIQNVVSADRQQQHTRLASDRDLEALARQRVNLENERSLLRGRLEVLQRARTPPKTLRQYQLHLATIESEIDKVNEALHVRGHFPA